MMARCGSIARKYTTAFTFTDTLSREITSCGGTSITTMRRSTRTICITPGITMIRPGPLTFQKRPSRNTTPRSYSRRMRNEEKISSTTMSRTKLDEINAMLRALRCVRFDDQDQPLPLDHPHFLAALEGRARARLPVLAVHVHAPALREVL